MVPNKCDSHRCCGEMIERCDSIAAVRQLEELWIIWTIWEGSIHNPHIYGQVTLAVATTEVLAQHTTVSLQSTKTAFVLSLIALPQNPLHSQPFFRFLHVCTNVNTAAIYKHVLCKTCNYETYANMPYNFTGCMLSKTFIKCKVKVICCISLLNHPTWCLLL